MHQSFKKIPKGKKKLDPSPAWLCKKKPLGANLQGLGKVCISIYTTCVLPVSKINARLFLLCLEIWSCLLRISAVWIPITMFSFRDSKRSQEKCRRETAILLTPPSQLSSAYLKYLIIIQSYNSNRIAGLKANATVTMSFIFLPVLFIHLLLASKLLNPSLNTEI